MSYPGPFNLEPLTGNVNLREMNMLRSECSDSDRSSFEAVSEQVSGTPDTLDYSIYNTNCSKDQYRWHGYLLFTREYHITGTGILYHAP